MLDRTELIPVHDGERRRIGPFDCEFIPVTHSVPHGFATAFHTPQGTILHSGDFKLDLTPVDGRHTDLALHRRDRRRTSGVRLLLSDSTNAERPGIHAVGVDGRRGAASRCSASTPASGSSRQLRQSHLHRVQQVAEAAIAHGRKVAFARPVDDEERRAGARDGAARHPRRPAASTSTRSATSRPARCASSAPARRASR